MNVIIIIPAYNEELNIENVVDNIIDNYSEYDYIIINDCSTDNTLEICQKRGYNYINLPTNLGIGGAIQTGYKYAAQNGYDFAVQIDGDGQHNPKYIEDVIQKQILQNADMATGSRFIENKGFQSSLSRQVGIIWLNKLIKSLCGATVTDATSGFRSTNKSLTHFFSMNYAHDYPEPEAIVMANLNGYKTIEVPMEMEERDGGVSSISGLQPLYYMVKVSLALIFSRLSWKEGKKYD